tara:strand:+ start:107 stop:682 length:576 start_codon:yes stop_codon:yes gene_type:complete
MKAQQVQMDVLTVDRAAVLAAGMLESLASDLGTYRRAGWWSDDPEEMRGAQRLNLVKNMARAGLKAPEALLRELDGPVTAHLSDIVRAYAPSCTMVGRGGVVRLAKLCSDVGATRDHRRPEDAERIAERQRKVEKDVREWVRTWEEAHGGGGRTALARVSHCDSRTVAAILEGVRSLSEDVLDRLERGMQA